VHKSDKNVILTNISIEALFGLRIHVGLVLILTKKLPFAFDLRQEH